MAKKMSFEESMNRLEEIVRTMEQGDAPLEESMKLFQEGTALAKDCAQMLENAQIQVQMVTAASDGTPVLEEINDESDA